MARNATSMARNELRTEASRLARTVNHVYFVGEEFVDEYFQTDTAPNHEGLPFHYRAVHSDSRIGGLGIVKDTFLKLQPDAIISQESACVETKRRFYSNDKLLLRIDEGFGRLQPCSRLDPSPIDAVVVVDYAKGFVTDVLLENLECIPAQFFVHTKSDPTRFARLSPIVFTNYDEYTRYRAAYNQFPLVVRTCGARGVELLSCGTRTAHVPAATDSPRTVIGAGDAVMAGFIDAILRGGSTYQALRWSQDVAAVALSSQYGAKLHREMSFPLFYGG